ncbi:MAG TPA: hypothetical protein VK680_06990 [Solirubrobacteraceae bacterium]|nr:hypothetical protein [Solirubrobacteraceae bacterium]
MLVALLAMLVLSAVTSASASASECPRAGESIALCSGHLEMKGSFAFSGEQQPETSMDVFNAQPYTNSVIECGQVKFSKGDFVAAAGKLEIANLYLEYKNCIDASDPVDCEVTPLTVDGGEGTGTGPGLSATLTSTAQLTLLGGGTASKWTKFNARSKPGHTCAGTYEWRVSGSATCKLPESTSEAVTHLLKCEESGDVLHDTSGHVGFYLVAEVKLSSGKAWSIQKV